MQRDIFFKRPSLNGRFESEQNFSEHFFLGRTHVDFHSYHLRCALCNVHDTCVEKAESSSKKICKRLVTHFLIQISFKICILISYLVSCTKSHHIIEINGMQTRLLFLG